MPARNLVRVGECDRCCEQGDLYCVNEDAAKRWCAACVSEDEMGDNDDTPKGRPPTFPRARLEPIPLPLPPPPDVDPRDVTGRILRIEDERERLEQYEERRQARLTMSPPSILRLGWVDLGKIVLPVILAIFGWWLSVRDGLHDRPTKEELSHELAPLKADLRDVERALDRLVGELQRRQP